LRAIPPFEFENWAVIAFGGIPNKVQVGDMDVDAGIPCRLNKKTRSVEGGNKTAGTISRSGCLCD
jgi:hypothetical protein